MSDSIDLSDHDCLASEYRSADSISLRHTSALALFMFNDSLSTTLPLYVQCFTFWVIFPPVKLPAFQNTFALIDLSYEHHSSCLIGIFLPLSRILHSIGKKPCIFS
jgi:hypothetical protein